MSQSCFINLVLPSTSPITPVQVETKDWVTFRTEDSVAVGDVVSVVSGEAVVSTGACAAGSACATEANNKNRREKSCMMNK